MTDPGIAQALEESAVEVLEQMFFVDAVRLEGDSPPDGGLAVELAFDGDPPGRLWLEVAPSAAAAIAGSFLAEDPDALSPRQVADVACELANMICGALLSRVESTATFHLSSPRCGVGIPAVPPAVRLDTGDGVLSLHIETATPICPAPAKSAF